MANKLLLKKSSVAARVPLATDLQFGELALNYADGLLYYKKSDGTTIGSIGSDTLDTITDRGATTTNTLTFGSINIGGTITGASNGTLILNTADSDSVNPSINITAGNAFGANNIGGSINITGGSGSQSSGGGVNIVGGDVGSYGNPGAIIIRGGGGGGEQNVGGGSIQITGGYGYGNGTGSVLIGAIADGANTNSTTAGDVSIVTGYAEPNNAQIYLSGQAGILTISGSQITLNSKLTTGTINNMSIGATTASTGRFTTVTTTTGITFPDGSTQTTANSSTKTFMMMGA